MQETWKSIKGYENLFEVSNFGNVKSLDRYVVTGKGTRFYRGRVLSLCNSAGYLKVHLTKNKKSKQFKVHSLVAMVFLNHTPKKGLVIDHIDNDRTNNKVDNLQIISHRSNISKGYLNLNTSSKYTGVYYKGKRSRGKKWRSIAMLNGKKHSLGSFDTEKEASKAYQTFIKNKT